MIQEFVDRFMANEQAIRAALATKHPSDYADLVKLVVQSVRGNDYGAMDPARIHKIDDGHYQGTLVFVIAGSGYQPSDYWYVKISYGSCSGCDTLEQIKGYSDVHPTSKPVSDYWTLALHIAQGIKKMGDETI